MLHGHVKIQAPFFKDVISSDCDFHKSFVLTGCPNEDKIVIESHPYQTDDLVEVTVIIRPVKPSGLLNFLCSIFNK